MPSLPVLSARQLIRVLEKVGFRIVRQRGSHIRMKHVNGRVVAVASHAGQDIGRGLLRKIRRDAELSPQELMRLLEE